MDLMLTPAAIKRFIYLLIITLIAFAFFTQIEGASAAWMVWSLLLGSTITAGPTLARRLIVIVATAFLAVAGMFLGGSLATYLVVVSCYLFIVSILCTYYGDRFSDYFYNFFLLNLFIILASSFAPSDLENVERCVFVFIGFGVALIIQLVWWPISANDNLRQSMQILGASLKRLNQEIFSCFLHVEFSDNIYLFERRIHEAKSKFIQCIDNTRKSYRLRATKLAEDERNKLEEALIKADKIFDILLDCAQLRRRVSDATTFSLCAEELQAITVAIDTGISNVMRLLRNKNYNPKPFKLNQQIIRLEDSYQNILRVSAREPLVFLLFVFSLKALDLDMESWQEGLKS